VGIWTNHAYGSIEGLTLTISTRSGALLIAFLALFVRLVGSHFWGLLCYALFHLRATTQPRDGLHHQHQAVLCNGKSDSLAFTQFIGTALAWRSRRGRPLVRSTAFALVALVNIVAFAVAGLFSSRVARSTSEVLLKPKLCGDLGHFGRYKYATNSTPLTATEQTDFLTAFNIWGGQRIAQGSSLAQSCVGGQGVCPTVSRRQIGINITQGSSCPFGGDICVNGASIRMDTGVMDSLLDFGINTGMEDRIGYRRVTECAPIKTDGYHSRMLDAAEDQTVATVLSTTSYKNTTQAVLYYYGDELRIGGQLQMKGINATLPQNLSAVIFDSKRAGIDLADWQGETPGDQQAYFI
jgi:hypothetical protein